MFHRRETCCLDICIKLHDVSWLLELCILSDTKPRNTHPYFLATLILPNYGLQRLPTRVQVRLKASIQ